MLDKAKALNDEIVRLRRLIHANPELSFQEFQTAALVADTLSEIGGYTIRTQVGKTGVVAELGESGPVIAIRADMDALPIVEANNVPYASRNPGVMHACGHDAHTAILLGVAHLLRQSYAEERWDGRVRLLFQPAEEAFDEDWREWMRSLLCTCRPTSRRVTLCSRMAQAWRPSIRLMPGFTATALTALIPIPAVTRSICWRPS
jgi:hypothetical protein